MRSSPSFFWCIYVDDILITRSSKDANAKFLTTLAQKFSLKDLGSINYFLGMETFSVGDGLFLCQSKYIRDLPDRTNIRLQRDFNTKNTRLEYSTEPNLVGAYDRTRTDSSH